MLKTLVLLAVGNVAVLAMIAALVVAFAPWMSPMALFYIMSPVMLLFAGVLLILAIVGARAGLMGSRLLVGKVAKLALIFGVLSAAYGELNTRFGWLIDNVITFETLAPMRVASLSLLWLGLTAALVSVGLLQLRGEKRAG